MGKGLIAIVHHDKGGGTTIILFGKWAFNIRVFTWNSKIKDWV